MNREEIRAALRRLDDVTGGAATPAERAIVFTIAVHAADKATKDPQGRSCPAGQCWLTRETLAKFTGLKRGLTDALERLAAKGLDVRVPVVDGARGRGAYSSVGHVPHYRLPKALVTAEGAVQTAPDERSRPHQASGPDRTIRLNRRLKTKSEVLSPSLVSEGVQEELSREGVAVELVITACVVALFDREYAYDVMVRYLHRTFRHPKHHTAESYARYLLRLYQAAPDEMAEIAGLKAEDCGRFLDEVEEPLAAARAAVRGYRLGRDNMAWCAALADAAAQESWPGMDTRDAVEAGLRVADMTVDTHGAADKEERQW
jgi:hypothetical protein